MRKKFITNTMAGSSVIFFHFEVEKLKKSIRFTQKRENFHFLNVKKLSALRTLSTLFCVASVFTLT